MRNQIHFVNGIRNAKKYPVVIAIARRAGATSLAVTCLTGSTFESEALHGSRLYAIDFHSRIDDYQIR